jgi:hypothetical protein
MSLGSTADIAMMLEEAGDPLTIGDVSHFGILDESSTAVGSDGGGEYQKRVTTILVSTGKFTLYNGATVTVRKPYASSTTTYRLDEWQLQDDGALTLLVVSRTL